jgi:quinohemoprotein ethanol dehydrogenase
MSRSTEFSAVVITAISLTFVALAGQAGGADANWYSPGGTHDESNFSGLDQVNTSTVSRLGLAWSLDLPGEVSLEATPLEIDGTLYFTGSGSNVYAVDARSGKIRWTYDPETWKFRAESMKLVWAVHRGVAYSHGKVFVGTRDGRLIALDAKSGAVIWVAKTVADDSQKTITGSPWIVKGKVIIGNGGADFSARGDVTAYDENTGKLIWRFYTVPGDPAKRYEVAPSEYGAMKMAAKTWGQDWWKRGGGGGTVWDNMTFDPELNRLYIGTGNGGPWNPRLRSPGGGDNLFLASIVALDADTGKYIWHYQTTPNDIWDFDATQDLVLANLTVDGKPRKVLMQANKNGFFYVIDRLSGKLLSAGKVGKVTWADHIDLQTGRPVESSGRYEQGLVKVWPSALGSHNWQNMSFSPRTGLVYIPYIQLGMKISDDQLPWPESKDNPPFQQGGARTSQRVEDSEDGKGALIAWDPVAQRARWKVQHAALWNGGVMSTAGSLVFQGTAGGDFSAYDAATGVRLWSFSAGLGIIASPSTYAVDGKQYIALLVGYGGPVAALSHLTNCGWKFGVQPRRLLVFALDRHASMAASPPADFSVHALDDPDLEIDPKRVEAGMPIYQNNCTYCHGRLLVSPGTPAPDLRESTIALKWDSFRATVKDGALLSQLMPKFDAFSDDDVRNIFLYIRSDAREVLKGGQPRPTGQCTDP